MFCFWKSFNQTLGDLPEPKQIHNRQHRRHHKQGVKPQWEDLFDLKLRSKTFDFYFLNDNQREIVKLCLMGNHRENACLIKMGPHVDKKEYK